MSYISRHDLSFQAMTESSCDETRAAAEADSSADATVTEDPRYANYRRLLKLVS